MPLVNRYDRDILSLRNCIEDEISPIMYATVYLYILYLLLLSTSN